MIASSSRVDLFAITEGEQVSYTNEGGRWLRAVSLGPELWLCNSHPACLDPSPTYFWLPVILVFLSKQANLIEPKLTQSVGGRDPTCFRTSQASFYSEQIGLWCFRFLFFFSQNISKISVNVWMLQSQMSQGERRGTSWTGHTELDNHSHLVSLIKLTQWN